MEKVTLHVVGKSRPTYTGRIEKLLDTLIVVELDGEKDAKGKPVFRSFHKKDVKEGWPMFAGSAERFGFAK